MHTGDVKGEGDPVGTMDFAKAVAERLGQRPNSALARSGKGDEITYKPMGIPTENEMMYTNPPAQVDHVGCDIYLGAREQPASIAKKLQALCEGTPLKLSLISARGTQVWPTGSLYTECVDHHRCRFERRDENTVIDPAVCHELMKTVGEHFHVVCYIPLKNFDGERGYLLAQGQ